MSDCYEILKNVEFDSTGEFVWEGIQKSAEDWIKCFPLLTKEDLDNKPEWFRKVEEKKWTDSEMVVFGAHCAIFRQESMLPTMDEEFEKWKKQRDD